jgi:hypothetical protein
LLAFANSAIRKKLEDAERHGWLIFETSGGIGEMRKRLEALHGPATQWAIKRFYCLADSDALEPDEESKDALEVRARFTKIATKLDIKADRVGHILQRRAVENYVELKTLKRWLCDQFEDRGHKVCERWSNAHARGDQAVSAPDKPSAITRALFAALALDQAPQEVWNHLDFSLGRGEEGKRRTADSIWDQLTPLQQSVLQYGFTKSRLRNFFAEQRHMPDRTGEIRDVLRVIQERL